MQPMQRGSGQSPRQNPALNPQALDAVRVREHLKQLLGSSLVPALGVTAPVVLAAAAARSPVAAAQHKAQQQHHALGNVAEKIMRQQGGDGQRPAPATAATGQKEATRPGCNCKRSKCLKLYCVCFAARELCVASCNCQMCHNSKECEVERQKAIRTILERNPAAFDAKFATDGKGGAAASDAKAATSAAAKGGPMQHKRGCRCRKSGCLKKYCECFHASVFCGERCVCVDCKNLPPQLLLKRLQAQSAGAPVEPKGPPAQRAAAPAAAAAAAKGAKGAKGARAKGAAHPEGVAPPSLDQMSCNGPSVAGKSTTGPDGKPAFVRDLRLETGVATPPRGRGGKGKAGAGAAQRKRARGGKAAKAGGRAPRSPARGGAGAKNSRTPAGRLGIHVTDPKYSLMEAAEDLAWMKTGTPSPRKRARMSRPASRAATPTGAGGRRAGFGAKAPPGPSPGPPPGLGSLYALSSAASSVVSSPAAAAAGARARPRPAGERARGAVEAKSVLGQGRADAMDDVASALAGLAAQAALDLKRREAAAGEGKVPEAFADVALAIGGGKGRGAGDHGRSMSSGSTTSAEGTDGSTSSDAGSSTQDDASEDLALDDAAQAAKAKAPPAAAPPADLRAA